jgi:hypothetical protein
MSTAATVGIGLLFSSAIVGSLVAIVAARKKKN